ncbi:MAG TPA: peptidoglycan DD-metalloendopeptidase family protein [Candidatus Dormibacteraeota bacterium]|nr:peptidoglycan DD-metalloendopeptidase family protein [Candidatus Dormibacteraeota bacterium]
MARTHRLITRRARRGGRRLAVRALVLVIGAAVIAVAALGSDQRHATADAITNKIGAAKQQLATDGATMARLRSELAAAANQEVALQKAIAELDSQIITTKKQVSDAEDQLAAIETALAVAQSDLATTRQKLADDRHQLNVEIVVMYKAENASNGFSNFLTSGDFNSLWQHVLDVHRLGSSEQKLIDQVTTEEQAVQDDVARIATSKVQQTQVVATLDGIVAQLDSALITRQQAQQQLLALQASDQQLLAANEAAAKQLNAQIAALQAQEAAALAAGGGNGHFAWPLTGPITQGFGCTTFPFEPYDPNCSTRHFHSGIDIAAACGTNIGAADSGIAHTYVSDVGYGLHVIIVHGNGWISVYGHMASFAIRDGQTVHRGQLIGFEGSSGNSTGCHLHFEVDLNNVPRNPLAYLS